MINRLQKVIVWLAAILLPLAGVLALISLFAYGTFDVFVGFLMGFNFAFFLIDIICRVSYRKSFLKTFMVRLDNAVHK